MRAAEQELRFQRPTPHTHETHQTKSSLQMSTRICADHQLFKRTTTMAIKASFSSGAGLLSVFGDNLDNSIIASRDAAGSIFINAGAVSVTGGHPTVANTVMIQVFGQGGNDTISLDESNGALPAAQLF